MYITFLFIFFYSFGKNNMSLALMALSQFTPHLCVYSGYKSDLFNKIVYMSGSHLDADVPGDGEMYYQTSFLDSERKALSFTKSHLRASRHRLFTYIFTTTPPPIPICTEDATTMEKIDAFRIERQRLETPTVVSFLFFVSFDQHYHHESVSNGYWHCI